MKWTFLVIACMMFSCSGNGQKAYDEKLMELQGKIGGLGYEDLINNFIKVDGFPESLDEVYFVYKREYPKDIEVMEILHFIDVFSRKGEWVGYVPLYGPGDSLIVSYLLLSAGIDGKLDNVLDPGVKLHLDDWRQKLALYNPDEYDGMDQIGLLGPASDYAIKGSLFKVPPYNAKDERRGKKDLLIYVHHLGYYRPLSNFPKHTGGELEE